MDVDPKLQTNRIADLGRTVRPSSRAAGVMLLVALECIILTVNNTFIDAGGYAHEQLQ